MADNHPPPHKEPQPSSGLSKEVLTVIRNKEFQDTIRPLVKKNETVFHLFRGFGFMVALFAGIFGYYLKADSEADDRQTHTIQKIIDEKIAWLVKTVNAGMDLRKERYLIIEECTYKKKLTQYEQNVRRYLVRDNLLKAFSGISQIYDKKVFEAFVQLVKFDDSVIDLCAPDAPKDENWREKLDVPAKLMRDSIRQDREKLEELSQGLLNRIFTDL